MLTFLYGHDKAVAQFVAALIPECRQLGFADNVKTIGIIDEEGRLIAGLVYHNFSPDHGVMEMSGASISRRWVTRRVIARMFQYPFLECGVQMMVQRIPADDLRQLGQLAAYGYTLTKIPRLYGRHRDGVLATLTYEDWCNNKMNKRLKHHLIPLEDNPVRTDEAA
jgi:hypothetical protein